MFPCITYSNIQYTLFYSTQYIKKETSKSLNATSLTVIPMPLKVYFIRVCVCVQPWSRRRSEPTIVRATNSHAFPLQPSCVTLNNWCVRYLNLHNLLTDFKQKIQHLISLPNLSLFLFVRVYSIQKKGRKLKYKVTLALKSVDSFSKLCLTFLKTFNTNKYEHVYLNICKTHWRYYASMFILKYEYILAVATTVAPPKEAIRKKIYRFIIPCIVPFSCLFYKWSSNFFNGVFIFLG